MVLIQRVYFSNWRTDEEEGCSLSIRRRKSQSYLWLLDECLWANCSVFCFVVLCKTALDINRTENQNIFMFLLLPWKLPYTPIVFEGFGWRCVLLLRKVNPIRRVQRASSRRVNAVLRLCRGTYWRFNGNSSQVDICLIEDDKKVQYRRRT